MCESKPWWLRLGDESQGMWMKVSQVVIQIEKHVCVFVCAHNLILF